MSEENKKTKIEPTGLTLSFDVHSFACPTFVPRPSIIKFGMDVGEYHMQKFCKKRFIQRSPSRPLFHQNHSFFFFSLALSSCSTKNVLSFTISALGEKKTFATQI